MMTPEHLSEIDARAESATPGPWTADHEFGHVCAGDDCAVVVCSLDSVLVRDTEGADLEFIAHAREDADALRAEVRRLTADLAAMTASRDSSRHSGSWSRRACVGHAQSAPSTAAPVASHT
jgi:hypothetical protein